MAEWGCVGVHGRKEGRRGCSPLTGPGPDRIGRNFAATASSQRWSADISELKYRDGKLHLAGVLSLHDRGLTSSSMATRATADIVVLATMRDLDQHKPDGDAVNHTDRGSRSVSGDLALTLADHDLPASFGRAGMCWDNPATESTLATINKEIRHIHGDWEHRPHSQHQTVLFVSIKTFSKRCCQHPLPRNTQPPKIA